MARRRIVTSIDVLTNEVIAVLQKFNLEYSGLSLRERVKLLAAAKDSFQNLGASTLHSSISDVRNAGIARMVAYFVVHVGEVITTEELDIISGIGDYPRRIRELRVESGYRIFSGASSVDMEFKYRLRPSEYLLTTTVIDQDAKLKWTIANGIRRNTALSSVSAKIESYFLANVNRIVTTEELAYVANNAGDFPRRTRELRTEQGYPIATMFTGRPDLGPGEYVLLDAERVAQPHDRKITVETQKKVYGRDNNQCQSCGWTQNDWDYDDARILELHHVQLHASRGSNDEKNLIVLCSKCHDEVHAGRLDCPKIKD